MECKYCHMWYFPAPEHIHQCSDGGEAMREATRRFRMEEEKEGEFQVCWKSAKGEFNSTSSNFNTYQKAVSEAEFRVKMKGSALGELYIVQLVAVVKLKRDATVEDKR